MVIETQVSSKASLNTNAGRNIILLSAITLVCGALWLRPSELGPPGYLGYALRVTAWIAFLFFIVAYVAQPVHKLFGGSRWLVAHRRYFGLAAAFAHTVHFGYVVVYVRTTTEIIEPATYLGGGLAFVLFWVMALTSNDASMRWLGLRWKRIHGFGMHYLWFVFALTFSGGIGSSWVSSLFFADCVIALVLRIWASRFGKGRGAQATSSSVP